MTTKKYIDFGMVDCKTHGYQPLTESEYDKQIMAADESWYCPRCNKKSEWVDQDIMEEDDYGDQPF